MKQTDRSEVKNQSNQPEVLDDLVVTQTQAEETKAGAGTRTVTGTAGTFTLTFNGQTTS